ncbi:MAG: DUF779 domain-containing protein [Planctomycetota bacterium]
MPRVIATEAARELISELRAAHGPLMFHQSGGCCDGSAPMCYPRGEFRTGAQDVLLGEVEDCEVWIGLSQFELWKHTQLILDAVPGRGAGFSIEAPTGMRFLTRSRVFDEEEQRWLEACPPRRGA